VIDPSEISPEDRQKALRLLVCLTLDPDEALVKKLEEIKADARTRSRHDPGLPDEIERIRDDIKAAVQAVLQDDPGLRACNPYAETPDWRALREVSTDFCNRFVAGVDAWAPEHRELWKQVCMRVTDVASAEYS
jgi:hypothetical protein